MLKISHSLKLALTFCFAFATSGCSIESSPVENQYEISNLAVDVNENFVGTIDEYRQALSSNGVHISWTQKGFQASSFAEIPEEHRYIIEFKSPETGRKYEMDEDIDVWYELYEEYLDFDNSGSVALSDRFWNVSTTIDLFAWMASAPEKHKFIVRLYLLDLNRGEGKKENLKSLGWSSIPEDAIVSTAESTWIRPSLKNKPSAPTPIAEVLYDNASYPCTIFRDVTPHRFDSYPTNVKFLTKIGVDIVEEYDRGRSHLGIHCDQKVTEVELKFTLSNSTGRSEEATLIYVTPKPDVSNQEKETQILEARIAGCTSELNISQFAESGCGYTDVEVFQYDLNTSECAFLGKWRDNNGEERVGYFEICSNSIGQVREDSVYSFYVRNLGQITYDNLFGLSQTVLSFSVLADK